MKELEILKIRTYFPNTSLLFWTKYDIIKIYYKQSQILSEADDFIYLTIEKIVIYRNNILKLLLHFGGGMNGKRSP